MSVASVAGQCVRPLKGGGVSYTLRAWFGDTRTHSYALSTAGRLRPRSGQGTSTGPGPETRGELSFAWPTDTGITAPTEIGAADTRRREYRSHHVMAHREASCTGYKIQCYSPLSSAFPAQRDSFPTVPADGSDAILRTYEVCP